MLKGVFLATFFLTMVSSPLLAQRIVLDKDPVTSLSDNTEIQVVPILSASEETSLVLGVRAFMRMDLPSHEGRRRSSVLSPTLLYTLNNQLFISLPVRWYIDPWASVVSGGLSYQNFPSLYYGIGADTNSSDEESYTLNQSRFSVNFLKKMTWNGVYMGARFDYASFDISELDSDGTLQGSTTPGVEGGTLLGVGPAFDWDTRDDDTFPRRGMRFLGHMTFYRDAIGSDYSFTETRLDARYYRPSGPEAVWAAQLFFDGRGGDTPFHRLSSLGGRNIMRGYRRGRYRDDHFFAGQIEWRRQRWMEVAGYSVGAVAFLGAGQVFHKVSDFGLDAFLWSYGVGLRFPLNERGTNIRLDFGFGDDAQSVIIAVNEAF